MTSSHSSEKHQKPSFSSRFFHPILAGASLRDRVWACAGALVAIVLTGLVCGLMFGGGPHLPLIVAPMGASAVLLFAVPASPLAQPWSIIGGNTISALMGVLAAHFIADPVVATGVGVALAIAAMSVTRCLHPPGGAAALTAVLGGPVVAGWGLLFPFVPVGLNSCLLVAVGLLFHKILRHNYPHVAPKPKNTHLTEDQPSTTRAGFDEADIDTALAALNEAFDIDRDDLARVLRRVEFEAAARSHGQILCRDIMSRDVVSVGIGSSADDARQLLLRHNIRTLPVIDHGRKLIGTVGLRELALSTGSIQAGLTKATTAQMNDRAFDLLPILTDGVTHAVIIVNDDGDVVGLISQTDLLSIVARSLPLRSGAAAAETSP